MKSKTLSLKILIKEFGFLKETVKIFNETFEEKRFIVACKQINIKNT